jgi:hypothetical protein
VSSATGLAATAWHKTYGSKIIIALVVLHVAAIAWYRLAKQTDLVRPMITGDKLLGANVPASRDTAVTRLAALLLALACAAGVVWVVRLGS